MLKSRPEPLRTELRKWPIIVTTIRPFDEAPALIHISTQIGSRGSRSYIVTDCGKALAHYTLCHDLFKDAARNFTLEQVEPKRLCPVCQDKFGFEEAFRQYMAQLAEREADEARQRAESMRQAEALQAREGRLLEAMRQAGFEVQAGSAHIELIFEGNKFTIKPAKST